MERLDEDRLNGSNDSSPGSNVNNGISILEVDGQEFEYRENGDEIEVVIPDDYPEEKKAALEKKADEFKHTLASAKRKAFEVNREREDLEEEKRRLREEREQLNKEKERLSSNRSGASSNSDNDEMLNAFGVESWDDVEVLRLENPAAYHRAQAKYNAEKSAQDAYNRLMNDTLSKKIIEEGYNPNSVSGFAKANGISRIDVAFDYYKRVNEKPKGTSLADLQKKSVKFVPRGGGTTQGTKQAPGMKDIFESNE